MSNEPKPTPQEQEAMVFYAEEFARLTRCRGWRPLRRRYTFALRPCWGVIDPHALVIALHACPQALKGQITTLDDTGGFVPLEDYSAEPIDLAGLHSRGLAFMAQRRAAQAGRRT